MKNWLKNLLFVLFSFVFLGLGILVAEIFIRQNGNPLKDPNFLADEPADTTALVTAIPSDSMQGWVGDTVKVETPVAKPSEETASKTPVGDFDVIIGMFSEKNNANREVKKLRTIGYENAYIFSKSSMSVVSAGLFTKTEAESVASDLKSKDYETIIKHR
jgi:cell division septation protein DedD